MESDADSMQVRSWVLWMWLPRDPPSGSLTLRSYLLQQTLLLLNLDELTTLDKLHGQLQKFQTCKRWGWKNQHCHHHSDHTSPAEYVRLAYFICKITNVHEKLE